MGQLTIDARGKAFRANLATGEVVLSFEIGLDPAIRHREFLSLICDADKPLVLVIQTAQLTLDDAKAAAETRALEVSDDDSLVTISANDESVTVREFQRVEQETRRAAAILKLRDD